MANTKYAIISGSRSGSTHLQDLLSSTNRAGYPQEYCNPDIYQNMTAGEMFDRKTENNVFGIKLVGKKQYELFAELNEPLDHIIWLKREDTMMQAISRYKAWTRDQWHFKKGETPSPVEYDYDGIAWCLEDIRHENAYFRRLLSGSDKVIRVSYERDLCSAPHQTVIAILAFMGISTEEVPMLKSDQYILEHAENTIWAKSFCAHAEPTSEKPDLG